MSNITYWVVALDERDAKRLEAQNAEGHSFILRCGTESVVPISVTDGELP